MPETANADAPNDPESTENAKSKKRERGERKKKSEPKERKPVPRVRNNTGQKSSINPQQINIDAY